MHVIKTIHQSMHTTLSVCPTHISVLRECCDVELIVGGFDDLCLFTWTLYTLLQLLYCSVNALYI